MTRSFIAAVGTTTVALLLSVGTVASAQPTVADPSAPGGAAVTDEQGGAATATPPTDTGPGDDLESAGEDLTELSRLSEEAGALGEELHLARAELDRTVAERDRLERSAGVAAATAAAAAGNARRDQSLVDHLASMRYRGGDTGATRAAVLAESPRDLVHRLDALSRLSGATTTALDSSKAASAEAARLQGKRRKPPRLRVGSPMRRGSELKNWIYVPKRCVRGWMRSVVAWMRSPTHSVRCGSGVR